MNEHAAPRVLVVEDEDDIAYILRFMFEREGFTVDHAADGRQALARLDQDPPHGVVLDIMLPYHDGIEIVERLREARAQLQFRRHIGAGLARAQGGIVLRPCRHGQHRHQRRRAETARDHAALRSNRRMRATTSSGWKGLVT